MDDLIHLQIRNPRDDETPIEASTQIFSSLVQGPISWIDALFGSPLNYGFEIYLLGQRIYFYVTSPKSKQSFVSSLITSSFPNSVAQRTKDPIDYILRSKDTFVSELTLANDYYMPIKTYQDFSNVDPLGSVLGFLAKSTEHQQVGIQILLSPPTFAWQAQAQALAKPTENAEGEKQPAKADSSMVNKKISYQGGKVVIRLLGGAASRDMNASFLQNLGGTFGAYAMGEGNMLKYGTAKKQEKTVQRMKTRTTGYFEHRHQILNSAELAGLWHPPSKPLAGIKNIAWGKSLAGEPPENIPLASEISDEEKQDVNFFAKTEFKNKEQIIGITTPDRRKHVYIVGKTGAGKSTLIANMAIDDIRRGRGVGIIDPHGDLTEDILDYIPKRRINDVVYLEAFDKKNPFHLNILEVHNPEQKHLVASGIVGIFKKMYGHSWGPRLEYILRNVIITLLEIEGASLYDALRLMADAKYRKRIIKQIDDPVIKSFWYDEFNKMDERTRVQAVSPIQNKLGQFVTAEMIRNIIANPKSSIDLSEIMDEGKILLLNLSQGKLGEDNAALLGAMIITQIQLAAMRRSFQNEEERRDFFLYVDEFQNFATDSFVKILSEARKFRLALTLANQYISQLDEEVSSAIFGNAGTLISFIVGATDSEILSKEYGGIYAPNDLVGLGKYQIVMKLSVDGQTSLPFPAKTLPPPSLKNNNREKIIQLSKEKFSKDPKKLG